MGGVGEHDSGRVHVLAGRLDRHHRPAGDLPGIHLDPLAPGNIGYLLWMIMGYRLVQAVLVVTVGRLGDMFGRVRTYNAGFAVFTAASVLLSFDPFDAGQAAMWLIGWRVLQAVGGSMLQANSTAILTDAFPSTERGFALGTNQVAALAGQFIGLVAGGLLAALDWRAVFWVNVPVGIFGTWWAYTRLLRPASGASLTSFDVVHEDGHGHGDERQARSCLENVVGDLAQRCAGLPAGSCPGAQRHQRRHRRESSGAQPPVPAPAARRAPVGPCLRPVRQPEFQSDLGLPPLGFSARACLGRGIHDGAGQPQAALRVHLQQGRERAPLRVCQIVDVRAGVPPPQRMGADSLVSAVEALPCPAPSMNSILLPAGGRAAQRRVQPGVQVRLHLGEGSPGTFRQRERDHGRVLRAHRPRGEPGQDALARPGPPGYQYPVVLADRAGDLAEQLCPGQVEGACHRVAGAVEECAGPSIQLTRVSSYPRIRGQGHVPAFQLSTKGRGADPARAGRTGLRDVGQLHEHVLRGIRLIRRQQVTQPVQGVTVVALAILGLHYPHAQRSRNPERRLSDFGVGRSDVALLGEYVLNRGPQMLPPVTHLLIRRRFRAGVGAPARGVRVVGARLARQPEPPVRGLQVPRVLGGVAVEGAPGPAVASRRVARFD